MQVLLKDAQGNNVNAVEVESLERAQELFPQYTCLDITGQAVVLSEPQVPAP